MLALVLAALVGVDLAVASAPAMAAPAGVRALAPAEGDRWSAAPGQAFNDGWKPLSGTATFKPCETIAWSFDRSREPGDRSTMINDVRTGLAALEPYTGLRFGQANTPGEASLTFRWGDLEAEGYPNAAGIGGPRGLSKGAVAFDLATYWTKNEWEGWAWREFRVDRPDLGPGWYQQFRGPGRVALVIHEVMHAMGFDHVEDFTSIMYPQGGVPNNQGQLSSGDIAGLKTMYLDRPCATASAAPSASPQAAAKTCIAGPDVERECWPGTTWTYSYCWSDGPKAVLQRKEGGQWVNVARVRAKRSSRCDRDTPYLVNFTGVADGASAQFRVYIPRQAGVAKPSTDGFTVLLA